MKDAVSKSTALAYGALCHTMFIAANGSMMVGMYYGMTHCHGTLEAPWSYVINALLLIQFPLTHSFLVSPLGLKLLSKLVTIKLLPVKIGVVWLFEKDLFLSDV